MIYWLTTDDGGIEPKYYTMQVTHNNKNKVGEQFKNSSVED